MWETLDFHACAFPPWQREPKFHKRIQTTALVAESIPVQLFLESQKVKVDEGLREAYTGVAHASDPHGACVLHPL